MQAKTFLNDAMRPALAWLGQTMGRDMATSEALVLLLAIAHQEGDQISARIQRGGPAHSYFQFEGGSAQALGLLMRHPSTARVVELACKQVDCEFRLDHIYVVVAGNDFLATIMARLLLFTDPRPLPRLGDVQTSWACYLHNWRPGRPHPSTWPSNYTRALSLVQPAAAPRTGDVPMAMSEPLAPAPKTAKEQAALDKRSLTVTSSDGHTVSIDPPQPKGTFTRGSGAIIVIGLLLTLGEVVLSYQDQTLAAFQAHDWGTLAGIALVVIPLALQKWDNKQQYLTTSKVAISKLDPMMRQPPAPLAPVVAVEPELDTRGFLGAPLAISEPVVMTQTVPAGTADLMASLHNLAASNEKLRAELADLRRVNKARASERRAPEFASTESTDHPVQG